jgi:hypothetical protein
MARNRKSRRHSRRGIVAAFVALALTAVLTIVAVSLDGGSLQDRRRNAQAVADAAAMAAAADLYTNNPVSGLDPSGSAKAAALAVAAANGYANDAVNLNAGNGGGNGGNGNGNIGVYASSTSSVTVNIPPLQGPYTGLSGYIEVLISYYQPVYFGRVAGVQQKEVQARAVSRGGWTGTGAGVIVLDPTGSGAFSTQGNGSFVDTQGPIIINSNNSSAVVIGGGGSITATAAYITGNWTSNGGGTLQTSPSSNQIFTNYHPTPDPYAYIAEPAAPSDGTISSTNIPGGGKTYHLTPGRFAYNGNSKIPNFTSGDVVYFGQASCNSNGGIYYIDGGGLTSNGANLLMEPGQSGGIMFFNNPRSGAQSNAINIAGNATGNVILSGLTSGPYAGIILFQERSSNVGLSVTGNGNFSMTGAFYAAGANLSVTGGGGSTLTANGTPVAGSQIGSQYISYDLTLGGGGNIYMGYGGDTGRTRTVTLVE